MSLASPEDRIWLISPMADLVLITLTALLFLALVGSFLVLP